MKDRVDIKKLVTSRSDSGSPTRDEGNAGRDVRCHRRTLSMVERQARGAEQVVSTHAYKFEVGENIRKGYRLYDRETLFYYDVNTTEIIKQNGRAAYLLVEATLFDDGSKGQV